MRFCKCVRQRREQATSLLAFHRTLATAYSPLGKVYSSVDTRIDADAEKKGGLCLGLGLGREVGWLASVSSSTAGPRADNQPAMLPRREKQKQKKNQTETLRVERERGRERTVRRSM